MTTNIQDPQKVMAWWNSRENPYEYAWFYAGQRVRTASDNGLYLTRDEAEAHRPERGTLHRLDPFQEWVVA